MIKILYIHHVSTIGGGSYCLLNILQNLDRSTYCPIVLLKSDGPLTAELKKLGIAYEIMPELQTIPYNKSLLSLYTLKRYLLEVKKSCRAFRRFLESHSDINIVHINNMMLFPLLKIVKECGRKSIIHLREHWPLDEHIIQLFIAQKYIEKYADHVIAINEYSASMVKVSISKCTIIHDWIDLSDRYIPLPLKDIFEEDMSDKKVFVYTGGLIEIKGIKEVAETFSEHITSDNARLLMLGVDPHTHLVKRNSYLQEALRIINSDRRIKCIPSTYKILDIIKQSYCNISYFKIPHANLALSEWIFAGKPCIAAKTEESDEYTCGLQDECLFNINDKEDFRRKILWLDSAENYTTVCMKIANGNQRLKSTFDKQYNVNLLRKVYESVLK